MPLNIEWHNQEKVNTVSGIPILPEFPGFPTGLRIKLIFHGFISYFLLGLYREYFIQERWKLFPGIY